MKYLKDIGLPAVIAVLVVVVASFMSPTVSTGVDVNKIAQEVKKMMPLGALAGPDIPSAYLHWGAGYGLYEYPTTVTMTAGTSTPCNIQAPTNATSSLVYARAKFDSSSTTAMTIHIAKGTLMTATTTLLGTATALSAGGQGTVVASTTGQGMLDPVNIFAPGTWLTVGMQGSGGVANLAPTGVCQALFIPLVSY